MPDLLQIEPLPAGGTAQATFQFHRGQVAAMNSKKRVVLILAGTRSGKTATGPPWLFREMRRRGAGDYLVATPTYPILDKAAAPEIDRVFNRTLGLGAIKLRPFHFAVSKAGEKKLWNKCQKEPTRIIFGHADDPDSLEAMTAKAAWLDECGQTAFKIGSWEAIQRRLSIDQGRALLTTTPYAWNWLKTCVYDPWVASGKDHPEIDVFQFDSTWNPAFPSAEYQRARRDLPAWKFNMFFRGLLEKPAGLVYDCFDAARNTCPRFAVPPHWRRFLGLDFGGVNTAGVFFAEDPAASPKRYYGYREYLAGSRTAKEHAAALLRGEPGVPTCVGGSKSEGQWRAEFGAAGLPVQPPAVTDVEVGIDRTYSGFKSGEVIIFDDLAGLLDEVNTYSRPVDERGNPQEGIQDKADYHRLDGCRYILGWLRRGSGGLTLPDPSRRPAARLSARW